MPSYSGHGTTGRTSIPMRMTITPGSLSVSPKVVSKAVYSVVVILHREGLACPGQALEASEVKLDSDARVRS